MDQLRLPEVGQELIFSFPKFNGRTPLELSSGCVIVDQSQSLVVGNGQEFQNDSYQHIASLDIPIFIKFKFLLLLERIHLVEANVGYQRLVAEYLHDRSVDSVARPQELLIVVDIHMFFFLWRQIDESVNAQYLNL